MIMITSRHTEVEMNPVFHTQLNGFAFLGSSLPLCDLLGVPFSSYRRTEKTKQNKPKIHSL